MSNYVISVEHLSKSYRLGQINTGTFTNDLRLWWAKTRGKPNPFLRIGQEERAGLEGETLWALKDVSFQVEQGEVLGIIGRNGAGKSTLLKILSRVTAPTAGRVRLKGRVASLLEVGTGFHPDLTGRENVYLNGAILGMTREEVRSKFDEIVAFAEVEKFIDTPVKRYSSGMFVRLAFAVAAHLDPEILIVDEVLAVGDAEFQKKSIGKMQEVGDTGRTVLFVSHNLPMIMRLCPNVMLLDNGHVKALGTSSETLTIYQSTENAAIRSWPDESHKKAETSNKVQVNHIRIFDESNKPINILEIHKPFWIDVVYELLEENIEPIIQLGFYNSDNVCLFITQDVNSPHWENVARKKGFFKSTLKIPENFFAEGSISVNLMITDKDYKTKFLEERGVLVFTIADRTEGEGVRGFYSKRWPGVMRPMLEWKIANL